MSKLLKYKTQFVKVELQSIEKVPKLFSDRNWIIHLNSTVTPTKNLKFDESEPVICDLMAELESETKQV